MGYRLFDHTADLGLEVFADSREGIFAEAALALTAILVEGGAVRGVMEVPLAAEGGDDAELLVNFLRELLYLWSSRGFAAAACVVEEAVPGRVSARLEGETYDPSRHRLGKEIKAATYHQAAFGRDGGKWKARVIFDI